MAACSIRPDAPCFSTRPARRSAVTSRARHTGAGASDARLEALPCPDADLMTPGGCFVSLHELRTHRLRGCVGRMDASQPLWLSVCNSAAGVLDDPRFHDDPVRLAELPTLEIEISFLSPMRPASSRSTSIPNHRASTSSTASVPAASSRRSCAKRVGIGNNC